MRHVALRTRRTPHGHSMAGPYEVSLESAKPEHVGLLAQLLELYLHDLSEIFPIKVGSDGRFGYDRLPLYFEEPDRRFPFVVRANDHPAGFALVTRGSPVTQDPADLDIAEFFVMRPYRRSSVGRSAAFQLWDRMPGRWIVRVSEGNRRGLPFWRKIVAEYTNGLFSVRALPGTPSAWCVMTFQSKAGEGRTSSPRG
jgi:predicted acetyltransferase